MASRILIRKSSSSVSATSKTFDRLLHSSTPLDLIRTPATSQCLRTFHSVTNPNDHARIQPSDSGSTVAGSVPRIDLARSVNSRVPATSISGSLGSAKIWRNEHISPFHPYKPLHAGMRAFPRWFTVKAQEGAAMHQEIVHTQHDQSTEKNF